ncbi:hypothetical protein FOZ63_020101 [Perkinsus olseni]|uniref:Uncharacterized protein n=1 Tax=Perkinsus olseni TaxID=32597 RepID=A0A7J6UFL8_PEROL|nr:hypothetical protein FOZ63_020101 [Perkinsus olseni]
MVLALGDEVHASVTNSSTHKPCKVLYQAATADHAERSRNRNEDRLNDCYAIVADEFLFFSELVIIAEKKLSILVQ